MPDYVDAYEFGPYQLDLVKRVLICSNENISLTPKAMEILVLLVSNAGQLVEKDELLREIWPDTFVEESNLTQNIFCLRRALGDDRTAPRYIETVARRGYRFVAAVKVVGAEQSKLKGLRLPANRGFTSNQHVIAVLPFINSTENLEFSSLADEVTDKIINHLSRQSNVRVMSHSAVDRYRTGNLDPQKAGKELHAHAVLVGRVHARPRGLAISVELVDPTTGWLLWGETFDFEQNDLLDVQHQITQQLLTTLKLKIPENEEKRVMARHTENTEAYSAYLEGRHHWGLHTRENIEKAISHFQRAIELDPNYALAYAAIVDCYLRLFTNYVLPPEYFPQENRSVDSSSTTAPEQLDDRVRLRFEWDWRSVERELRRLNDLKADYPGAHQWCFAYHRCKDLYEESVFLSANQSRNTDVKSNWPLHPQIPSLELTVAEQLQVLCAIVREQIDAGNYDAGCKILEPWWSFGNRPKIDGLNQGSYADLLFTAGELAGFVASSVQLARGQRHAEELLNGSIALFEQLGLTKRAIEAKISLALCFHRQGLFDLSKLTLVRVLENFTDNSRELRSLALMRLGGLERNAGRLKDALSLLTQTTEVAELCGPSITARCYLELASIHKDLAVSEDSIFHFDHAKDFYLKAIYQFEAVGHHRYVAAVENNIGLLLLGRKSYLESELHLLRARTLFEGLSDNLRGAQVNETLARLHIDTNRYELAQHAIDQAIRVFELADGDTILAEALTTRAVLAWRNSRFSEAKKNFEAAYKISQRCGDHEGAGQALLIMFEELGDHLEDGEKIQVVEKSKELLGLTQQKSLQVRLNKSIAKILSISRLPNI